MNGNRTKLVLFGAVLLCSLCFVMSLPFLSGQDIPSSFYWGLPVGLIFGVATLFYLSETWDSTHLRPKDPKAKKAGWKVIWFVPVGILLSNILPGLVGEEITGLLAGSVTTWVFLTVAYMIVRIWRHRPGN